MNNSQSRGVTSRLSRITAAGFLIAFSGTAIAMAGTEQAEDKSSARVVRATTQSVAKKSVAKVAAKKSPAARIVETEKVSKTVDGLYTNMAQVLKRRNPLLRDLSESEIIAMVKRRAEEIANEKRSGKVLYGATNILASEAGTPSPLGGEETQDGVLKTDMNGGLIIPHGGPGPGSWNQPDDIPAMGEGYREDWSWRFAEERAGNMQFLYLRSLGMDLDLGNGAFADTVADGAGGIWMPLPPPTNSRDFDGDGELFDPLPARPIAIYYQFLEEAMTDLEWDDGDDMINQIRFTNTDDNMDMVIDMLDPQEDEDGIADTWTEFGVNISVIPPPVAADFDADRAPFLLASGFPATKWGDGRPIFLHPDAEAAWRLAQRLYAPRGDFTFQDSFSSAQVLEPEERQQVLTAMRAIEDVTNIIFLERPDGVLGGFGVGYPLNPVGYTSDTSDVLVDPGALDALAGPAEFGFNPDDDYPWFLIAKGDPQGADIGGGSTGLGTYREPASIDFIYTDIDGDGFPDTPDLNGDGLPDEVILSSLNFANVFAGFHILDTNQSSAGGNFADLTAADSSFIRVGIGSPDPGLLPVPFNTVLDPDLDGDAAVVEIFGLQLDLDGDLAGDSIFPTGTAPSPVSFPNDAIPCELLAINQLVLDNDALGTVVNLLMRHLGFLDEHRRPDREEFVRINEENIIADALGGFAMLDSGTDKFANFIENFDTTNPGGWVVSGAPTSGAWATGIPDANDTPTPVEDYAVDTNDLSMAAFITGLAPGDRLVGTTIFESADIFGPEDGTIRFAYYLDDSTTTDPLPEGEGLTIQTSNDNGATWSTALILRTPAPEWRLASVTIGETRNDGLTGLPEFRVRFIATNSDAARVVEMGVDRIRVQNPYDFLSIMHPGQFSAAISGQPGFETITVLPPNTAFQEQIGNATGLSIGDRVGLTNLYQDPVLPDGGVTDDPCRADINGDGIINASDIALFLQMFNSGDLGADFAEPFGVLDVFDLVQFFNDFQQSPRCQNDGNDFGLNNLDEFNSPG